MQQLRRNRLTHGMSSMLFGFGLQTRNTKKPQKRTQHPPRAIASQVGSEGVENMAVGGVPETDGGELSKPLTPSAKQKPTDTDKTLTRSWREAVG